MIRFGKSAGPLLSLKRGFFENNDCLAAELRKFGDVYRAQPARCRCKCCNNSLQGKTFRKQEIDYILCQHCGHLNGAFEDSDAFCQAVYTDAGGADYAKTYNSADREAYQKRKSEIYGPKAAFLRDALVELGDDPPSLKFRDFGAGSGYFVGAMRDLGWPDASGFEVSETQVRLADAMLGEGAVQNHGLDEVVSLAQTIDADVVSMIGVLEHVQQPREIVQALAANPRVRYFYISVPLFSPCVMLEAVFPDVFQRQLSAGHTHLYTESSLDWMCKEFKLSRRAEWWFGTDIVDLFRSVTVELERNPETESLSEIWGEMMSPAIDDMQRALDERKSASEVHMLLSFDGKS